MSPRLLVLSLAVLFAIGCNAGTRPAVAAAQTAPPAPSETEAAELTTEAVSPAPVESPAAVAPVESPAAAEPARFATTQATTAPVSALEPVQPNVTAAEHFDAQLAALSRNEIPPEAPPNIAEDDRKLLRSVVDSLMSFRMTLRSANTLRQTKVAPLIDLSEKVRSEIPLSLPTLALCRSVERFGVYDPIEPARFAAGRETPVVVYCEVDHFRSNPAEQGGWETKLTYEAVLYSDTESAVAVINKKPTQIVDRCRNRRRDFFLADRMTIPANLPVGKYVLKVTVIDQLANLVAEKTVPVFVAPN
jgi:hypothetical protein